MWDLGSATSQVHILAGQIVLGYNGASQVAAPEDTRSLRRLHRTGCHSHVKKLSQHNLLSIMHRPVFVLPVLAVLVIAGLVGNFDSLLLHMNRSLPGTPDEGALALLDVWWPVHSLHLPDRLAVHSFVGAPHLSNHLLGMPILQSAVYHGLVGIIGPLLALNLILIASQAATHVLSYFFLSSKEIPVPLAMAGATALAVSPWYSAAAGSANVIAASLWTLPLLLIVWDSWLNKPTTLRAASALAALVAGVLAGVQHLTWMLVLLVPYVAWRLWQRQDAHEEERSRARRQLMPVGLGVALLMFIYPLPNILQSLQGGEIPYVAELAAPQVRSTLGWLLRASPVIFTLGVVALLSSPVNGERWVWLAAGVVGTLVGLGLAPDPLMFMAGGLGLPRLPLADQFFYFGIALFAIVTLAGLLASERRWLEDIRRAWAAAGAVLVVCLISNPALVRQVPRHTVEVPDVYREIALEPEDYILLQYPFGLWSASNDQRVGEGTYLARYAIWHGKRPAGGPVPFFEPRLLAWAAEASYLSPANMNRDPAQAAQDLARVVDEGRVGYAVVHTDLLDPMTLAIIRRTAEDSGALCPAYVRGNLIVYRARWHPEGCEIE